MKSLKFYSTKDLEKELENRKHVKPEKILNPNFDKALKLTDRWLDGLITHNDVLYLQDRVFEEFVEAVYGTNIWNFTCSCEK